MSRIEQKTPLLVLRRFAFEEKGVLAHVYSPSIGRLAVIAKGKVARSHLIAGALLVGRLYYRPHREVQQLAEAEWDVVYQRLWYEAPRVACLFVALELLEKVLVAPDPGLFDSVRLGLLQLDQAPLAQEALRLAALTWLREIGGPTLGADASWVAIEEAYQQIVPTWRPLASLRFLG